MENEKQIKEGFSQYLDDLTPWNQWIGGFAGFAAEKADGMIYSIAVDRGYRALPDDFKEDALLIMDSLTKGNYDAIAETSIDLLVDKINTSFGDEVERIVLGGIWNTIRALIKLKREESL